MEGKETGGGEREMDRTERGHDIDYQKRRERGIREGRDINKEEREEKGTER